MHSLRLYKYRDSYGSTVYTYSTHLRYGKLYTHSFGTDTFSHDVSAPWFRSYIVLSEFLIGRKRSKEMEFLAKWVNNINLCVCISNLLNLGFRYIFYLALFPIFYSCNIWMCPIFNLCWVLWESSLVSVKWEQ